MAGSKWIHRLSDINTEKLTATCAECGPVSLRTKQRKGRTAYFCSVAYRAGQTKEHRRTLQTEKCPRCGFVFEALCQADVDHIIRKVDGGSNAASNLQILCANCHRLKTWLEKIGRLPVDFVVSYPYGEVHASGESGKGSGYGGIAP